MAVVIADLTGPGGLDALITASENAVGSSTNVHDADPINTDKFKKSFKPVDARMKRMQNLSRFNDDFHAKIMQLTDIPTITIQHTVVTVTVKDKITGNPIEGATGLLSVSDKVGSSDYTGLMFWDMVPNGPDKTLKITMPNYIDVLLHIGINQGKENHFDVLMEKGSNPA